MLIFESSGVKASLDGSRSGVSENEEVLLLRLHSF